MHGTYLQPWLSQQHFHQRSLKLVLICQCCTSRHRLLHVYLQVLCCDGLQMQRTPWLTKRQMQRALITAAASSQAEFLQLTVLQLSGVGMVQIPAAQAFYVTTALGQKKLLL